MDIDIQELTSPECKPILERAQQRIEEAILLGSITQQHQKDDVEISSFPISVMKTAAANDAALKRRYALAEAKRASDLFSNEHRKKILAIACLQV